MGRCDGMRITDALTGLFLLRVTVFICKWYQNSTIYTHTLFGCSVFNQLTESPASISFYIEPRANGFADTHCIAHISKHRAQVLFVWIAYIRVLHTSCVRIHLWTATVCDVCVCVLCDYVHSQNAGSAAMMMRGDDTHIVHIRSDALMG